MHPIRLPVAVPFLVAAHLAVAAPLPAAPLPAAEIESQVARHQALLKQIAVLEAEDEEPGELPAYLAAFKAATGGRKARVVLPGEVWNRVRQARFVLVGDIHPLPASQDLVLEALERMEAPPGGVTLALEWIERAQRKPLEAFLRGQRPVEGMRGALRFDEVFGFGWPGYRDILVGMRARRAHALLAEDSSTTTTLSRRDRLLVRLLARSARTHPGMRYLVPYGVAHLLGENHVAERLRAATGETPVVLITSAPELYFEVLRRERDPSRLAALDLGGDVFYVDVGGPLAEDLAYRAYLARQNGWSPAEVQDEDRYRSLTDG